MVEPEEPTTKGTHAFSFLYILVIIFTMVLYFDFITDCYRTIKYDERIYLRVDINPHFPEDVMTTLIGPNFLVVTLRQMTENEEANLCEHNTSVESNNFLRRILEKNHLQKDFFLEQVEGRYLFQYYAAIINFHCFIRHGNRKRLFYLLRI